MKISRAGAARSDYFTLFSFGRRFWAGRSTAPACKYTIRIIACCGFGAMMWGLVSCHSEHMKATANFSHSSRIFLTSPPAQGAVMYEADVNTDIPVAGFKSHHWGRPVWHLLNFVPQLRLRQYTTDSSPVRSPSYMPRVDLYTMARMHSWGARTAWFGTQFTVGHHSNGQDGCTFTSQDGKFDLSSGKRIGNCVEVPDRERELNHLNGSFGLNFVRISLPFYLYETDAARHPIASHFVKLSMDLGTFSEDADTAPVYPGRRLGLEYRYEHLVELDLPVPFDGGSREYIAGIWLEGVRRFGVEDAAFFPGGWSGQQFSVEGEVSIAQRTSGLGIFIGGYAGRDYYNISFDEEIAVIRGGVFWRHAGLSNLDELGK
jgi:hypothetical protein